MTLIFISYSVFIYKLYFHNQKEIQGWRGSSLVECLKGIQALGQALVLCMPGIMYNTPETKWSGIEGYI